MCRLAAVVLSCVGVSPLSVCRLAAVVLSCVGVSNCVSSGSGGVVLCRCE